MSITSSLPSIESTNLIADPFTEPVEDKHTTDEQPDKNGISRVWFIGSHHTQTHQPFSRAK